MNPVVIRKIKIGEGMPKICVPIAEATREEIISSARDIRRIGADIAEWRADWYEDVFDFEQVERTAGELRAVLGDMPVLFTFRTAKEGGEREVERETYIALNQRAAESGYIDLVDAEVFVGDDAVKAIIEKAHGCGVKVIASNHDFSDTPAKEEIVSRLCRMQKLGADILKIAVMPQSEKDVLTLLAATEKMSAEYADRPIVTMSMAGMGVISRLCGETFNSAITFGSAGKASAPGQIDVEDLRTVLGILHKNM